MNPDFLLSQKATLFSSKFNCENNIRKVSLKHSVLFRHFKRLCYWSAGLPYVFRCVKLSQSLYLMFHNKIDTFAIIRIGNVFLKEV